ncbi:MAG: Dynamin family protein [Paenibacillaceae bacterium]|jgi:GTPase Era involved in 16S rRNA processing/gas vesicle protein|nr:Dynamin family protein [Paenibacillaceae bacterium]
MPEGATDCSFDDKAARCRIRSILDFVQKILDVYQFDDDKRMRFFSELNSISQKIEDSALYLGVLGEFATGKSTFINALIRSDLLKKQITSGTTAAPTIIRYGKPMDIRVKYLDGSAEHFSKHYNPKDGTVFRNYLHHVSANEEVSKTVKEVVVYYPSDKLADGLVIVDMPGVNADERRHLEVTRNAIKEVCDAVIVVMHSVHHFTGSLEQFIYENLQDQIHRCIFVINQIDLLDNKSDRDMVHKSVSAKVSRSFGIKKPHLFCVSSLSLFDHANNGAMSNEKRKELQREFEQMEKNVVSILKQQRVHIQTERTASLLLESLSNISGEIKKQENVYASMHDALSKNQVPDIKAFTHTYIDSYQKDLDNNCVSAKDEMNRFLSAKKKEAGDLISSRINGCSSKDMLKSLVEKLDSTYLDGIIKEINQTLENHLGGMEQAGKSKMKRFESDFSQIYQSLKTLGGKINAHSSSPAISEESREHILKKGASSAITAINSSIEDSQGKTSLGVGMGVAVAILLPGIGLVLGAILGGVVGWLFGQSLSDMKAECIRKIKGSLEESFKTIQAECAAAIENRKTRVLGDMKDIILGYVQQYEKLLAEMNERDNRMADELARLQKMSKNHMKQLEDESRWLAGLKKELMLH